MNLHIQRRFIIYIVTILASLLVFLSVVLVYKYLEISPERFINRERFSRLTNHNIILDQNDLQFIEPWMTFDYINHIFGLPSEYLKLSIGINDPNYPNLTVSHYAKENILTVGVFTDQIKNAVKNYLASVPSQ